MSKIPTNSTSKDIATGTILFSSGQSKNDDFWDDTDLIDHWDRTVELYRNQLSNKKGQTSTTKLSSKKREYEKVKGGYIKKQKYKQPVDRHDTNKQQKKTQDTNLNDRSRSQPNSLGTGQDDFSNLIMSWYYAGYYTALHSSSQSKST